jgi:hypothetical protein
MTKLKELAFSSKKGVILMFKKKLKIFLPLFISIFIMISFCNSAFAVSHSQTKVFTWWFYDEWVLYPQSATCTSRLTANIDGTDVTSVTHWTVAKYWPDNYTLWVDSASRAYFYKNYDYDDYQFYLNLWFDDNVIYDPDWIWDYRIHDDNVEVDTGHYDIIVTGIFTCPDASSGQSRYIDNAVSFDN